MVLTSLLRPAACATAACLLLLAGCSREARLERHLEAGNRAFDARQFEKAKIEYVNALKINNTNPVAMQRLGKILFIQGQVVDAYPLLVRSRDAFPDDLQIREFLSVTYARATGDTNRTLLKQEVDAILARVPTNETAILLLASTSRSPEELAELESRIADLRARAGNHPVFRIAEAEILRIRGDTNGCETALREALAMDPDWPTAHLIYGNFLVIQNRHAEAEEHLRRAAELAQPHEPARQRWAQFLYERRRLDEAKSVLEEIHDQAPEQLSEWVLSAEIALTEKRYEDAEKLLARVLGQAPTHPAALRALAQVRLSQQRAADAVGLLQRLTQIQPTPQTYYQLALARLMNRQPAEAVEALERATRLDPPFLPATLLLAEMNLGRGRAAEAAEALRAVVANNPRIEQAQLQLVRAETALGRTNEALAAIARARELFPTNTALIQQAGLILSQLGDTARARAHFEEALAIQPDYLPALEQVVSLDLHDRQYDQAARRIEDRLGRNDGSAALWVLKAAVDVARNDTAAAESSYRRALQIDGNSRPALMGLAQLYIRSGRQEEALAELERLVAERPNDLGAQTLRGMLYSEAGEFEKARSAYEKALEIQPNAPAVLNNLAYILAEPLGKPDLAYPVAIRARQVSPEEGVVADTLGWIEYRRGQYSEALRLISEAATRIPDNPEIQYHLGMSHYMMGNEGPAREALEKAVGSGSDFPGKEVAREYLAMLRVAPGSVDPEALRALENRRRESPRDLIALSRLGAAYESTGALEKAVDAYEAALNVNPDALQVITRLAPLYAGPLNNPERALSLARKARDLAPNDPEVAFIAGRTALRAGDSAWAYGQLTESARRLTDRSDVALALARAAYSQGQVGQALGILERLAVGSDTNAPVAAEFLRLASIARNPTPAGAAIVQQALSTDPHSAPALMAYGAIAAASGRFNEARDAWQRLLERHPGFTPAARELAILHAEHLHDDELALRLGTRARQAFPRDDILAAALGKAACRSGDHEFALSLLTQAAQTRTNDASLFYHLGLAHEARNNRGASREALEKALALQPDAPFADDARKRLANLAQ